MTYPVLEVIPSLKKALDSDCRVILQAPPGAGKSTILPLHLLEEPWLQGKKIIMLEPRRLAARSVAIRMASLLEEEAGQQVGYRTRFESRVSSKTRIEVVTEGILTRMIQHDNSLDDIGLVIFDEFHERSLQADLSLVLSLQVQQLLRDDLRILIMSATLDGKKISSQLNNAPVISSTGKRFPVDVKYLGHDPDTHITSRITRASQKAFREGKGDILVFLPGAGEILRTHELLEAAGMPAVIHPLYGDLPFKKQQEAILPDAKGRRKIVLATSIAETSLTIEGIRMVIDSGYSRVPKFDPRSGLTRLETVRVTKDAADQRTGRAGRLAAGICYRLWSEAIHRNLVEHRSPEILDADLAPLVLELAAWGVKNVNELNWITPPPPGAVSQAFELLQQLEAIDEEKKITSRGRKMVNLPTHPRIAHMLLEREGDSARLSLATDIAALLEERDPLPKTAGVDLSLRVSALRKYRAGERVGADIKILDRAERLARAWRKLFKLTEDNSTADDYATGTLIALAYPERISKQGRKNSELYKLANGRPVKLPDHDPLVRESWLAVAHLDSGNKEGKIFLAAPLNEDDLYRLAHESQVVRWNKEHGRVEGVIEKRIGNLVLESRPLKTIPDGRRVHILCEVVRNNGLKVLGWNETHQQWQARVMSLRLWRPDEAWPDVSDEHLLATVEEWLSPYLLNAGKLADLQRIDLSDILRGLLPWHLQSKLDNRAPSKIEVPSGSMVRITYFPDGRSPVIEVRLQEVFGLLETPAVNDGRVKLLVHLLSPGFKPVQVTQDLKSFWQNLYHEVRKELRRRYPKHAWPEDPWTAKAVRGVRRKS